MFEIFDESFAILFLICFGMFGMVWVVKEFTNFVPTLNLREAFYSCMGLFILLSIIKILIYFGS